MLAGRSVLDWLGIGLPAFRIAGGLLLFWIAFEMVFELRTDRKQHTADLAVTTDGAVLPMLKYATLRLHLSGTLERADGRPILRLAGSYREQRVVLNTLRFLSNELRLSLVCFGVADAREAISGDVQLARRFDELVLKRWSANAEFEALVTSILRNLPLREPSVLSARTLRRVCHRRAHRPRVPPLQRTRSRGDQVRAGADHGRDGRVLATCPRR